MKKTKTMRYDTLLAKLDQKADVHVLVLVKDEPLQGIIDELLGPNLDAETLMKLHADQRIQLIQSFEILNLSNPLGVSKYSIPPETLCKTIQIETAVFFQPIPKEPNNVN